MPDLVIFNILIPLTDDRTRIVHPTTKFHAWVQRAVEKFGGLTTVGVGLEGFWHDPYRPPAAKPVADRSNWYKIGVPPARIEALRAYIEQTAADFGQKCIYLERAGEAEFVWDPARRPVGSG
jgi:hypothetical protein